MDDIAVALLTMIGIAVFINARNGTLGDWLRTKLLGLPPGQTAGVGVPFAQGAGEGPAVNPSSATPPPAGDSAGGGGGSTRLLSAATLTAPPNASAAELAAGGAGTRML